VRDDDQVVLAITAGVTPLPTVETQRQKLSFCEEISNIGGTGSLSGGESGVR
jgi:hypothetical protein